jgi:hypothetical protein
MTKQILAISPYSDLAALIDAYASLDERVCDGTSGFKNSSPLLHVPDSTQGADGAPLNFDVPLTLRAACLMGITAQSPVLITGTTRMGKTLIVELLANCVFGPLDEGYYKLVVNRGVTIEECIDIDGEKLRSTSMSEAISPAPWLELPVKIIDECNRAPAQLLNLLLHVVDKDGPSFHSQRLPVGTPYTCNGQIKRYSQSFSTMNNAMTALEKTQYAGVFPVDRAYLERNILVFNVDCVPTNATDTAQMLEECSARPELRRYDSMLEAVLRVYESIDSLIPRSALASLFQNFISGMSNCIRTKNGRFDPAVNDGICSGCRFQESTPFCGRVSAPTSDTLLWMKRIASVIAVTRAVKVLAQARMLCASGDIASLRAFTGRKRSGDSLYKTFKENYLNSLKVSGEDVVASYILLAPSHVWHAEDLLKGRSEFEGRQEHLFASVAKSSWSRFKEMLSQNKELLEAVEANEFLTQAQEDAIDHIAESVDCAMLNVFAALRLNSLQASAALEVRAG